MATDLTAVVGRMMEDLDSLNFEALPGHFASDAQAVEEIRGRWIRSSGEIADYFKQIAASVTDVNSQLDDIHEISWGDTGVVTCSLEQDYVLDGVPQHVSAPTTVVLRREDGDWKVALIHSVPIPVHDLQAP
jgi:ketosteroid isomerase-like protein